MTGSKINFKNKCEMYEKKVEKLKDEIEALEGSEKFYRGLHNDNIDTISELEILVEKLMDFVVDNRSVSDFLTFLIEKVREEEHEGEQKDG